MATKKFDVLDIAPEDYTDEGLMNLANAIIKQAADDYEAAYLGYYVGQKPPEAVIKELEKWFESEDYQTLTKIDGKRLLKMIKINALEKLIAAYEAALNAGREAKLRLLVVMPRHVQNINQQIPPIFMDEYKEVMSHQLKELKRKLRELKEDK